MVLITEEEEAPRVSYGVLLRPRLRSSLHHAKLQPTVHNTVLWSQLIAIEAGKLALGCTTVSIRVRNMFCFKCHINWKEV